LKGLAEIGPAHWGEEVRDENRKQEKERDSGLSGGAIWTHFRLRMIYIHKDSRAL
jgi:hypothetical protein